MDISGLKCRWVISGLCTHRAGEKGEKDDNRERTHRHLDLCRDLGQADLRTISPAASGQIALQSAGESRPSQLRFDV